MTTFAGALAVIHVWGTTIPALAGLALVPVVAAGTLFGVWGGLLAGALTAALLAPFAPTDGHLPTATWAVTAGLAVGIGSFVGVRSGILQGTVACADDLTAQLVTTYQRTLHLIVEALELRDPATGGHSERVAANAQVMGQALGLDEEAQRTLYWAGLLHDVGKIAVPESILQKPGPLSPEEWATIRAHPTIGARLIRDTSSEFCEIADAVATHHERWDGSGYPDGLAGGSIPLYGRILAVVDVFEALTADRPYRAPLPSSEALRYICDMGGLEFDPELVARFERLVHDGTLSVSAHRATHPSMFDLAGA
ncbi:MAG TPA: HD-GYP domain-containing protein [Acidimicrobiales bacterium]|nr:HD-GYP domain-containing protein [Acidimicrobiales bacterium]